MPKALIWGEALVGSGHARIQSELARSLEAKGWEVFVITSSKTQTDHFDFGNAKMIYLPPLRLKSPTSNPYKMENLFSPNGKNFLIDQEYQTQRKEAVLQAYNDIQPDAVVTEMWPYARVAFDFELIPLAEAIKNDKRALPPRLYSIGRDFMFAPAPSNEYAPNRNSDRHALVRKYFEPHSILARGDRNFLSLEESLGTIPRIMAPYIDYVGYFASSPIPKDVTIPDTKREVLVSSGGGVTEDSFILFEKAMEARKYSTLKDRTWRILIPHACPEEKFQYIRVLAHAECPEGKIVVERNRKDFSNLLTNAALLICHGGNTIIEAVTANIPVLVVPRALAQNNREQQIRAERFWQKGLVGLATLDEIRDARNFANKVDETLTAPRQVSSVEYGGADRMAGIMTQNFHDLQKGRAIT